MIKFFGLIVLIAAIMAFQASADLEMASTVGLVFGVMLFGFFLALIGRNKVSRKREASRDGFPFEH